MENINNFLLALFTLISVVTLLKVVWAKIFKYKFCYQEILLDASIILCTGIISWLLVGLYNDYYTNNLFIKAIFGFLFIIIIPYIFLYIRKWLYLKLQYSLIHKNIILHIGYYYLVAIVSILLIRVFY